MSPRLPPPMSRLPRVYVHLLPALIPEGALRGGVAVVIDVLRATTTMIHALAAGCDAIMPCGEIDEARRVARSLPVGASLLAGERQGLPIEGFDLGNSPGDCTPDNCSGKTLVMTTTNGTRAILASLDADRVLVAAFVNRKATIEALKVDGRPIHMVCAGTDGQISLEDSMLAGALAHELDSWAWEDSEAKVATIKIDEEETLPETVLANDEAEIAVSLWRETESIIEEGYTLVDALSDGRGGRRVLSIGLDADLEDAARLDRFPFSAELLRDPLRIVPSSHGTGPRLRLYGAS
jgi:2-phosphosulfolactate phosphatase